MVASPHCTLPLQELKELQRQGMSIQAISKLTGWDRKTIRKYMQAAGLAPECGPRSAPPSKLDAFKPYLEQLVSLYSLASSPF